MERKRSWSRIIWVEDEEEEEEEENRRISLRKRKGVRYSEDYYGNEEEDDEEEKEEEDEEDDDQPGPSTQNTHKQRAQENGPLPVTCGNKTGILDQEKLDRGEKCIECEGHWFRPPAFEEYAGKGSSKKWKATIFYEDKPLQFWFEQGYLTTKGFKGRQTETTKQKKLLSSNCTSESSSEESEIQSTEETEEDVKDEDWLQGSEELALETEEGEEEEEERVGAENGGEVIDSEADKSKEEKDKMEKGERGDEDMPAVADDDNSVSEELETEVVSLTPEKSALQKKVKIIVKRLPGFQAKSDCQSNCVEDPPEDSWCKPLDEDAQTEEGGEQNGSATDDPSSITAAVRTDPSQTSDPPIVGGVEEENEEEFTQSHERKEDGEREIKTETGDSPTPVSAQATSSPDIKPDTEDIESTCSHTANLSSSTVTDTGFIGDMIGFEDCENANNKHFNMSRSEVGGQPFATGNFRDVASNTSPIQRGIKEESIEAMSGGLLSKPLSNTDAATSGHDAAELQVMQVETRVPQATQASGSTPSSDTVEAPSSRPSTSCDLDTMDLDQLKREKIKMQIKVLKLQEEYYTLKLKEHKKLRDH